MTKARPIVAIFDGHALLHRGFHAIPHLTTKDGVPTNGVYGFTMMLLNAIRELKPAYVVVAWDMPGKTFRHDLDEKYKGTRKPTDPDLVPQFDLTLDLLKAFNIPVVGVKGFEADDLIGTLAAKYKKQYEVMIVTGDMDELQLVDEHVSVYTLKRGFSDTVIYDPAAVEERYGVNPAQFLVTKALKGDSSDNIPGVKGIGEKTAGDLIKQYDTLDNLYEHLDELKPAVRAKLEAGKEDAYRSLELSTIVCDVPNDFKIEDAHLESYDREKVVLKLQDLEFRSLIAKLPQVGETKEEKTGQKNLFDEIYGVDTAEPGKLREHLKTAKYTTITKEAELSGLVKALEKLKVFAVDTETTSLDPHSAELVGISLSWKAGVAVYIPAGHTEGEQLNKQLVLDALRPVLENADIKKVGHNIKYDYQIFRCAGVELKGIGFDTMVAAFLISPITRSQTLSSLALTELGIEMIEITELIGKKGKGQKTFDQTPIDEATPYAAEDADITWRLYEILEPRLKGIGELTKVGETMEWPLIPVLGDIELTGVELDVDFFTSFSKELEKKQGKTIKKIYDIAGGEFNINSTQQLKELLFTQLGLESKSLKKVKSGGASTAASELEKLRGVHPIIDLIFDYREVAKLKSTYVDTLPLLVNEKTGRVHTSYSQTIAQTGRLSSNNPNLQNIPVRTPLGKEIRKGFVAPKGRRYVAADYSQIELRLAAALSNDKPMIDAFKRGADIHVETAATMYGVEEKDVTKEMRYAAKTVNFGVLYGMSPHGLTVATGMTYEESKAFIDRYYEVRQGVAKYIEKLKLQAREEGFTETIYGRRRPCPDVRSSNFMVRSGAERTAVNMPLQGTAADLMKLAMIKLTQELPKLDGEAHMILQIHDELIVECDEVLVPQVKALLEKEMIGVAELQVPIEVGTSEGPNWGELE
jgi:DNA polymerase-1